MAFKTEVVWTALPNGVQGSGGGPVDLKLSVHVAPRLSGGDTTLATFPDFLSWASTPQSFQVKVEIGQTSTVAATIVSPARRNDLWQALFGSSMPVHDRNAAPDYTDHQVVSYPAGHIHEFLRARAIDSLTEELPKRSDLLQAYGAIGYGAGEQQKELERALLTLASERNTSRYNDFAAVDDEHAFAALREFHRPRRRKSTYEPITVPQLDFQQALSLIGEHPLLTRLLGVVFDLTVSTSAIAGITAGGTLGKVTIVPSFSGAGPGYANVRPATQAVVGTGTFEPYTPSSEINQRHLKVGNTSAFEVLRVDVDGGGLKSAFLADSLKLAQAPAHDASQKPNPPAPDVPATAGQPTLRSAGLQVVHHKRGGRFVNRLDRSKALKDTLPDLITDDLVRGYVLDVFDGTAWRSTAQRSGQYHFPGIGDVPVDDEASFAAPPTKSPDPDDPKQLNLQQSLVRWDGWSLAGSRPGRALAQDGQAVDGVGDDGQFGIEIQLKPKPGTLPLLRFGTGYRLRMRAVDLAGNTVPFAEAAQVGDAAERVSPRQVYLRHEPVPSPDVYTRQQPVPGESLLTLVIRGNYDSEAAGACERTIAPPRIAQALAEHHGLFDTAGKPDKTRYALIAARESAHYDKVAPIDPTQGVPYMPDVLARGAALRVLDGTLAGQQFAMHFEQGGDAWPRRRPFKLVLQAGAAQQLDTDDATRRATVALAKADVVTLRLSSSMAVGDVEVMGLHGWLAEHLGGQVPATTTSAIAAGRLWAFTPHQLIQLVYAVRQPLKAPAPQSAFPTRAAGDTFARIAGGIDWSRRSTSKLQLRATYTEPFDDGPGKPKPGERTVQANAFDVPIGPSSIADFLEYTGRHEFGDTRHRTIEYRVLGTSKFAEHFAVHQTFKVPAVEAPMQLSGDGLEVASVVVRSANGTTTYPRGTAFTVDGAAGTITFKDAAFNPGDDVQVDCLPIVTRLTEAAPAVANVKSSARPAAPEVVDVVPIFKWSTAQSTLAAKSSKTKTSKRSASALRIFLNRPWWSSGAGEVLGVLTWTGARTQTKEAIPESMQPYVSDWGADPVFGGKALPRAHPRPSEFPNAPQTLRKLELPIDELAGAKVDVAGHPVKYDAERELWYCDVALATGGAYTPMVRLAVARLQPDSLPGLELSRIVLLDVMQVNPSRTVVVKRGTGKQHDITSVTLTGLASKDARAQVVIERKAGGFSDPALGWKELAVKPMTAKKLANGQTQWTCGAIDLAGNHKHRLVIQQYERVDSDAGDAYRLVHQDVVSV